MEETLERLLNFFVIEDESGVSNLDNSSTSRILLLFTPASIFTSNFGRTRPKFEVSIA